MYENDLHNKVELPHFECAQIVIAWIRSILQKVHKYSEKFAEIFCSGFPQTNALASFSSCILYLRQRLLWRFLILYRKTFSGILNWSVAYKVFISEAIVRIFLKEFGMPYNHMFNVAFLEQTFGSTGIFFPVNFPKLFTETLFKKYLRRSAFLKARLKNDFDFTRYKQSIRKIVQDY